MPESSINPCTRLVLLAFALLVTTGALRAQEVDWSVQVTPYNQVFPALELSQAPRAQTSAASKSQQRLGDGNGLVTVRVRALHEHERIRVHVGNLQWLIKPTQLDALLPAAGHSYELHPDLDWNAQRLAAQRGASAATLQFHLDRDGSAAGSRTVPVDLRTLNDALYFVRDGTDSVDLSWIFAAFVNENDRVVDRLLENALQSGIVEKFTGYADVSADADSASNADRPPGSDSVMRQVWAIWHALSARGIRYSGADPGIDRGPRVFSQRVRFLADTWTDRSANCIDGSVLLASAFQRIGLRSFLVLVPGHAFVGFYTDADAQHAAYLETTLLGATLSMPQERPAYVRAQPLSAQAQASLASFDAALRAGAARYANSAAKFDGRHRPDYAIIDIAAARAFGIRPISFEASDTTAAGGR
jgi:hypothetical protein